MRFIVALVTLLLFVAPAYAEKSLPSLSEAEAIQPIECPGNEIVRAGFELKDGRYGLVYLGPVVLEGDKPYPGYPHVWIRFEGSTPVSVLLALAKGKIDVISIEKLQELYPTICDLAGMKA